MKDEYIYGAGCTWTRETALRNNPFGPRIGAIALGDYLESGGSPTQSPAPAHSAPARLEPVTTGWQKAANAAGWLALFGVAAAAVYEYANNREEKK